MPVTGYNMDRLKFGGNLMSKKLLFAVALICVFTFIDSLAVPAFGIAEALTPGTKAPEIKTSPGVSVDVSITAPAPKLSLEETLLVGAVASFFGMDVKVVANLYSPPSSPTVTVEATIPRTTVSEPRVLLSAVYMSQYYEEDPVTVIDMKNKGQDWDDIAEQKGKGKKAKPKKKGSNFENDSFIAFVTSYYDVPPAQVEKWLSLGMTETEILFALNLASRANANVNAIINEWRKGESWEAIGRKYKISMDDLAKPVAPRKKFNYVLP
jgi:hypothetical protein